MAQIGGHALVPVVQGNALYGMAIIASGIVDQHMRITQLVAGRVDGLAQGGDITQIAMKERYLLPLGLDVILQFLRRAFIEIEQRHAHALGSEVLDNRSANA
jgi:hypothetical protein